MESARPAILVGSSGEWLVLVGRPGELSMHSLRFTTLNGRCAKSSTSAPRKLTSGIWNSASALAGTTRAVSRIWLQAAPGRIWLMQISLRNPCPSPTTRRDGTMLKAHPSSRGTTLRMRQQGGILGGTSVASLRRVALDRVQHSHSLEFARASPRLDAGAVAQWASPEPRRPPRRLKLAELARARGRPDRPNARGQPIATTSFVNEERPTASVCRESRILVRAA